MTGKTEETKERILKAAEELIEIHEQLEHITIRKIAETAGVGVGLINYHFGSRDELIHFAMNRKLEVIASDVAEMKGFDGSPREFLISSILQMADVVMEHQKFRRFSMEYEIKHGGFQTSITLLPALRQIYGDKKSEMDLRLMGFQIIAGLQLSLLKEKDFPMFSGYHLQYKEERDQLIRKMIENIIGEA